MKGDDIVARFDITHRIKQADPKATKQEFAYVEPKENPHCGSCNMYLIPHKCIIVSGNIDPTNGSCNYWSYRRTAPIEDYEYETEYTKQEAGYVEYPDGPRCGVCEYFEAPKTCQKVIGEVDGKNGCCNRWEKQ
jgi:hypothetical protein